MDIYGAIPEYFKDVEDIIEEDIEEVTRDIGLCNYDYIPEDSDIETYEATPQPELEDVIEINGSPRILACRTCLLHFRGRPHRTGRTVYVRGSRGAPPPTHAML